MDTSPETHDEVAVLLVEPDTAEANQVLTRLRALLGDGMKLVHVPGGEAAMEAMEAREFHLILSELVLPGVGGIDFFQSARFQQPDAVRVLLATSVDEDEAIDAINSGGVYRVITRPWEDAELDQCVRNALDWGEHGRTMRRLLAEQRLTHRALAASLSRMERAQRQSVHVERLATVGRLTSGIIHEMRNQLTGLQGVLSAFQDEPSTKALCRRGGELVKELTARCASIESFARGGGWSYEMEEMTAGELLDLVSAQYAMEVGAPGLLVAAHPDVKDATYVLDSAKLAHALLVLIIEGHARFSTSIRLRAQLMPDLGLRLVFSAAAGAERARVRRPSQPRDDDPSRAVVHIVVEAHGGDVSSLVPGADRTYARVNLPAPSPTRPLGEL